MGEVDIKTLTIEQYLMSTQGNQAPGMVKHKFRMKEKDIEDMTVAKYMKYEAKTKSLNLYDMVDLGASINIMPRLIFKHLNLANLKKTNMLVEMDDMTRNSPLGTVENVLVKINKFLFPSDFIIMDTVGEPNETMILGRPFLATIQAQMDVFKREIALGVREDNILFNMYGNEPEVEHKEVENLEKITSRWHLCKPVRVFYDNECGKDYGMLPTCNLDLSFYNGYDAIYRKERLRNKLGHTNVNKSVRNAILNEWVLNSFDVESDYGKTRDDPYSRRFDEYKEVFENEIKQLGNKYDLRIGKKGYVLDDVWEKCEKFHRGIVYPWHDEGFKEEERWESGTEKIDYEPSFVDIETFEIKMYSFKEGRRMIRKEMVEDGKVQRKM
nr:hypothetical protein [Tanacetum cinerariifolium]